MQEMNQAAIWIVLVGSHDTSEMESYDLILENFKGTARGMCRYERWVRDSSKCGLAGKKAVEWRQRQWNPNLELLRQPEFKARHSSYGGIGDYGQAKRIYGDILRKVESLSKYVEM